MLDTLPLAVIFHNLQTVTLNLKGVKNRPKTSNKNAEAISNQGPKNLSLQAPMFNAFLGYRILTHVKASIKP